jgi:hypothetical protein
MTKKSCQQRAHSPSKWHFPWTHCFTGAFGLIRSVPSQHTRSAAWVYALPYVDWNGASRPRKDVQTRPIQCPERVPYLITGIRPVVPCLNQPVCVQRQEPASQPVSQSVSQSAGVGLARLTMSSGQSTAHTNNFLCPCQGRVYWPPVKTLLGCQNLVCNNWGTEPWSPCAEKPPERVQNAGRFLLIVCDDSTIQMVLSAVATTPRGMDIRDSRNIKQTKLNLHP